MKAVLPAGPAAVPAADYTNLIWLVVAGCGLILVTLAAYVVIAWLRRRALSGDDAGGPAFSMEGLEAMRRRGQLSDEEYRRVRRRLLGVEPPQNDGGDSPSSRPQTRDDGQTDRPPQGDREREES